MKQIDKSINPGIVGHIVDYGRKYIDYKMGLVGAIVMGAVVFGINYHGTQDVLGATTAGLKQGGYTFFLGGVFMRMSERLAVSITQRSLALLAACLVPSTISIILTFILHSLKGTPKPIESTLLAAMFVIPATGLWGFAKRNNLVSK